MVHALTTTCSACHADVPAEFKFCGHCGQPISNVTPARPQERRLLTVMMIDLKGSTALADRVDIEDVQVLVDSYHRLAAHTIERAGGHVAKYMGDGVMAFFGYPNPIERPAAQAVDAALDLAAAWKASEWDPRPTLRVGIDTGEVLVDSIGQAASRTPVDVTGEAANVAARVEAMAPLDGVTITERTQRLIGAGYRTFDRGPHQIRGVAEPIHLYDVIGRAEAESFTESPFVGRADELEQLQRRYVDRANARPMLIEAGPGLGKTRLLREFAARMEAPTLIVRGRPDQVDVPFASFAEVLDWHPPSSPRRRIFESAASALGEQLTDHGILIIDDAQWIDASSLEVIEFLIAEQALPNAFIALAARPASEHENALGGLVDRLALSPLDEAAANQLAVALVGDERAGLDDLVDRAEGVPLFVEQLARYTDEHNAAGTPLPSTLHELLAVQLDRTGPARRLAQVGSVFGRSFPCDAVSSVDDTLQHVEQSLHVLSASGLVEWNPGDTTASFRHALVRDVAYRSLLRSERRSFHARVADVLESVGRSEPAVLAQHRTDAADHDAAANLWLGAAQRALTNHAYVEANRAARAALDSLAQTPPGTDRDRRELMTLLLAAPTVMMNESSTEQVEAWFDRARALAAESGDENERLIALVGIASTLSQAGRHRDASDVGGELIEIASAAQSKLLRLMAFAQQGMSRFNLGDFAGATSLLHDALALWDPARHDSLVARVPLDPGVMAMGDLCAIELFTGRRADAFARIEAFEAAAGHWEDGHGRAIGLGLIARALVDVGEHDMAQPFIAESNRLAADHGALHTELQMRCLLAISDARSSGLSDLAAIRAAEADIRQSGTMHSWTSIATAAAEFALEAGAMHDAIEIVDMVVAHGVLHGETYSLPKALLTRAAAHRAMGDQRSALDDARAALKWAEEHTNTFFIDRAKIELGNP